MMRGFLFGIVMGVVTSVLVLGAASLVAVQPAGSAPPRTPATDLPETAPASEPAARLDLDPAGPDAAPAALDRGLGQPAPPVTGTAAAPDPALGPATQPAAQPETGLVDAVPAAPGASDAPSVPSAADAPVQPPAPSDAPAPPMSESDLSLSTEPAQPRPPESVGEALDPVPAPPTPAEAPAPGPGDVAALEAMLDDLTEAPAAPDAGQAEPDVAIAEAPDADAVDAGQAEADGAVADAPGADQAEADVALADAPDADAPDGQSDTGEVVNPDAPEPVSPPADPAGDSAPDIASDQPGAPDAPEVDAAPPSGEPALPGTDAAEAPSPLPAGDARVTIRRPTDDAPAADPAPVEEEAVDPDAPPLRRHAAVFERPEGLPLMALVLLDDGSLDGAAEAVAALGLPVTVALDPGAEGAAEAMADYRARGIEVAAVPDLPAGARAEDVEVTLEAGFGTLDQAVALVDPAGTWQASGGVAEQTVDRLAGEGRGLVVLSSGLGGALRLAEASGVPAAEIYRDLDAEGQDARVIRRFLDQAAFRARQDGSVVLLGRIRPDTLSALTLWSTANRAGQVAIAPLSAVLLED